jgi:hypothetical protein
MTSAHIASWVPDRQIHGSSGGGRLAAHPELCVPDAYPATMAAWAPRRTKLH